MGVRLVVNVNEYGGGATAGMVLGAFATVDELEAEAAATATAAAAAACRPVGSSETVRLEKVMWR